MDQLILLGSDQVSYCRSPLTVLASVNVDLLVVICGHQVIECCIQRTVNYVITIQWRLRIVHLCYVSGCPLFDTSGTAWWLLVVVPT